MSVYAYWEDDEQSILRTDVVGEWTWEDYLDAMYRMVSNKDRSARVDHIVDLRHSNSNPRQGAMAQLRRIAEQRQQNPGITIIVGANAFITSLLDTFSQIYGERFTMSHAVESVEDAYKLIAQARDMSTANAS